MSIWRDRRTPIWLLIIALPVLALMGMYFYHRADTAQLNEAIAELDAADPRWRLVHIFEDRKILPADQNGYLKGLEVARLIIHDAGRDNELQDITEELPAERRMNPEQEKQVFAYIERNVQALELARHLKRYREGVREVHRSEDYLTFPFEDTLRGLATLLEFDILYHLQFHRMKDANDSCHSLYNAAIAMDSDVHLLWFLVQNVMFKMTAANLERVLARGELSDGELKTWQDQIAEEVRKPRLRQVLRGERAYMYYISEALWRGDYQQLERHFGKVEPRSVKANDIAWNLRDGTRLVNATLLEPKDLLTELRRTRDLEIEPETGSVARAAESFLTLLTSQKCLHAALGVERYRLKHRHFPKTLEDVVKEGFLPAMPIDPFDGEPLRYRHKKDGVIIYSISRNGKDDGGEIINSLEGDEAIRLWLPEFRDQPALPSKKKVLEEEGE